MTPRERRVLLAVGAVYAAVVIPIGVHKGGDFTQELEQSERLLRGLPLYEANPEKGIWWPPFTALGLVPFALVARSSLTVAKACWAALNVCCLGWALVLARRWTTGWRPIVLAVAAVGKPLQSNFEHLNVTPILLGLIVATAAELEQRREARAGGWLGLATAIKGFPALVFLYFLVRRRWRGLAAGLAVAAGLTVAAMLPYGPVGAVESVARWLRLSQQGTTLGRMGTQSLAGFAFFFKWPSTWIAMATGLCVGAVLLALRRPARAQDSLSDVGLVTLLAVLVSPVAWLYYHTLAFPAWVAVLSRPTPDPARREIWRWALLGVAGILTSGVLTFGLYPSWLWFIGQANYTWGSLLLLAALVIERVRRPVPVPSPT